MHLAFFEKLPSLFQEGRGALSDAPAGVASWVLSCLPSCSLSVMVGLGLLLGSSGDVRAESGPGAFIQGDSLSHELSWTSLENFNYQVESSRDLLLWEDTGVNLPGTGGDISHEFNSLEAAMFYRVRWTEDLYAGGFLSLPTEGQEFDTIDGVCIAFDLNLLPQTPDRIRIYRRLHNQGDSWKQVGLITEFAEISGLRFVRGNVIWLPELEGEYDLQAAALDANGSVIASAIRKVVVGLNALPTVAIVSGPVTPSLEPVEPTFEVLVGDEDEEDYVRRVDYFDNGVYIGSDDSGPEFGNSLRDEEGDSYILLKGTHSITARAYGSRGGESDLSAPYVVEVTSGNSRPTVEVLSPVGDLVLEQGESFTVSYNYSDADGVADIYRVQVYDVVTGLGASDNAFPFDDILIDTTGWALGTHQVRVKITDYDGASSYPVLLTVVIRSGVSPTFAQFLVETLVDEATAPASEASFLGVEESTTTFSSGLASGLQMNGGVVLTTGAGDLWNNGDSGNGIDENDYLDEQGELIFPNFKEAGDPELELRVSGSRSFDAAALEFDVFCVNGQLEFEYQFGSEEYDEYVNQYNDGFMVTVDGVVVSFVPDCSSIVSVNSVHPVLPSPSNRELFLDDDDDISPTVSAQQVEYDGMTIRLRSHILVEPGQNHRIRLVIADVTDDQWDSGLFIRENSVLTRPIVP